jgi:hypothetical protein
MLTAAMSELNVSLWAPPGTRCHQQPNPSVSKIPNLDDLANIAEALVGAYFRSQGSFFSAWQLISWLHHHSDEEDKPEAWESAVLGHLLFGTGKKFKGQTHTYIDLQDVEEVGEKILRVTYSDEKEHSRVEYRRCGPNRKSPEERQQDDETWKGVDYSHKHLAFISSNGTLLLKSIHCRTRCPTGCLVRPLRPW